MWQSDSYISILSIESFFFVNKSQQTLFWNANQSLIPIIIFMDISITKISEKLRKKSFILKPNFSNFFKLNLKTSFISQLRVNLTFISCKDYTSQTNICGNRRYQIIIPKFQQIMIGEGLNSQWIRYDHFTKNTLFKTWIQIKVFN